MMKKKFVGGQTLFRALLALMLAFSFVVAQAGTASATVGTLSFTQGCSSQYKGGVNPYGYAYTSNTPVIKFVLMKCAIDKMDAALAVQVNGNILQTFGEIDLSSPANVQQYVYAVDSRQWSQRTGGAAGTCIGWNYPCKRTSVPN